MEDDIGGETGDNDVVAEECRNKEFSLEAPNSDMSISETPNFSKGQ